MKKKQHFSIRICVLCIFLLCGCFYGCTSKKTSTTGDITLNVCTSFGEGDGRHEIYQSLLTQFETDSGISVSDESEISNEAWKESILSRFTSGEIPDVLFFFSGQDAETLVANQEVIDFDTIRASYPSYGSNINTSILNTMKASDGKNYALPVSGYWEGLFINDDLFEQYDISIPTDWDSFLDAISAFDEQGIIPIAASLGEVPHYWFEFLIYNHSGPAGHLSSVPTTTNPLPDSWVNGLTDLKTLFDLHAFPENTGSITEKEAFALFQDKKAAMLLDGSWQVGNITDTKNVRLIPFPTKADCARQNTDMIGGFSMGFYITKQAWDNPDKQKAAVDFIMSMSTNESILSFNSNGSAAPISVPAQEGSNPLLQSISTINLEATAYIAVVQDTIDVSVRNALFLEMYDIANGTTSIEDALHDFVLLNEGASGQ